jgi:hypothetical protein
MTHLGPCPEKISFGRECFEVVGQKEYYLVVLSAPSYPKHFDNREEAEDFARRTGRTVSVASKDIMRRVKW